jgi:hypothetical protein
MQTITASRTENLPIGELSRLSGVNIETIRYYERSRCCQRRRAPQAAVASTARRTFAPSSSCGVRAKFSPDEIRAPLRLKIEHRMFCHITQNWLATPLTSRLAVVELIANTTTMTGLTICCELDTNAYPKGVKVSEEQMAALNLKGDEFHPDWNYSISPRGQIVEP